MLDNKSIFNTNLFIVSGLLIVSFILIYFSPNIKLGFFTQSSAEKEVLNSLRLDAEQEKKYVEKALANGYYHWNKSDYETALEWFESIEAYDGRRRQKEYAILGLYDRMCNDLGKACGKFESYKKSIWTHTGA